MLEFVHLTGSSAGKDSQTRRKVRSQAMRDFRRRQREEREAASASKSSKVASTRNSTGSSRPPRVRSTSAMLTAAQADRKPGRRASPRSEPSIYPDQDAMFPTAPAKNPVISFSDEPLLGLSDVWHDQPHVPGTLHRAHSDSAVWQMPTSQNQSSIPRSPTFWGAEITDPFQSPAQIEQMLAFCKSYIHWLRPGTDADIAGGVLSDAWQGSQAPMLLAACCLASVGHLDAVQPNRPGGNYDLYKARVLSEVSERMKTPATAVSDETIGSLGCLLSYEMSRGSGEAITHLRGLKGLVSMKSRDSSMRCDGISMMLETLDLLHAAIFDSQPVFTTADTNEHPESLVDKHVSEADIFTRLTPLLQAEQEVFRQTNPSQADMIGLLPVIIDASLQVLQDAQLEVPSAMSSSTIRLTESIEKFGEISARDSQELRESHNFARACHLNCVILYNLIVKRIPQRHTSNQKYADALFSAVRGVTEATWQNVPYLRLWILLTGAVASQCTTRRSFFKAQLVRAIYSMGRREWLRIKDFMLRYLELKQVLERPARRATPPLEMITPVTVDPSYLYAGWPEVARPASPLYTEPYNMDSGSFEVSSRKSSSTSPMLAAMSMYGSQRESPPFEDHNDLLFDYPDSQDVHGAPVSGTLIPNVDNSYVPEGSYHGCIPGEDFWEDNQSG